VSTPGRDPDEDVRRLLDQDGEQPGTVGQQPSPAHDLNILRAAREFAASDGASASGGEVAAASRPSPPRTPSRTAPSRMRTWALAASVSVVLVGVALEWRALHSSRTGTQVGSPSGGLWVVPGLLDAGMTRGQREAPRIDVARGATTVRLRLRLAMPANGKAFDVELSTSSGRAVHSLRGVHPTASNDELDVDVPASVLRAGSYVMTVRPQDTSDGTAADDYVFSVP
jgi:hypothetical protein